MQYPLEAESIARIKVIGVGGGGSERPASFCVSFWLLGGGGSR